MSKRSKSSGSGDTSRRAPLRPTSRRRGFTWLALLAAAAAAAMVYASTGGTPQSAAPPPARAADDLRPPPVHGYDVVREYPHDPEAFTQGLVFRDGFLYESTGLNGKSSVRKVEIETGRVVQRRDVDEDYFAEGLTDWGNRLIQLTWTTNVAFVYDLATFEPVETLRYPGEGWGLAHDGRRLLMSDGTTLLRFLEPETFRELGRVQVRDGAQALDDLNELEVVKGQVYANVWYQDRIAIIEPESGRVTGWIDLAGLRTRLRPAPQDDRGPVLNGIAYDAAADRLFVTGKLWPRLFEIRVRPGAAR